MRQTAILDTSLSSLNLYVVELFVITHSYFNCIDGIGWSFDVRVE